MLWEVWRKGWYKDGVREVVGPRQGDRYRGFKKGEGRDFLKGCDNRMAEYAQVWDQGRAEGWFLAAELHLTLPPHLKSLPPHPIYLGPQNYRKMYMKLIHLWHFNANVYLVNPYFLTAQGKMRKLVRR